MVARVRAILRRANLAASNDAPIAYDKGGLKIDFTNYEVSARGNTVKLTLKEFELLRFPGSESKQSAQPRSTSRSRMGRRDFRDAAHGRRAHPAIAQGDRKGRQ